MASPSVEEWKLLRKAATATVDSVPRSRPARAWTLGRAEDAIALATVLRWADKPSPEGRDGDFEVALSPTREIRSGGEGTAPPHVTSTLGDGSHRCPPDRSLLERIKIRHPTFPVDLVAVRLGDVAHRYHTLPAVVARLRPGGHLAVVGRSGLKANGASDAWAAGLDPAGTDGRLFVKVADVEGNPDRPPDGSIAELPLASDSTDITLADYEFQARLVSSHYNLARALAGRFTGRGQSRDDLNQVAMVALVKAARRYQPDHQATFASYATTSILGELKRHFRDKAWMMRPPRSLQERILAIRTAREELTHTNGGSPTINQLAAHLGVSDEEVLKAMEAGSQFRPVSLDAPSLYSDEGAIEVAVEDEAFERNLSLRDLKDHLAQLSPTEKMLVQRVYFQDWTQRQVAEQIGVSQMQVSRMMTRTLGKLRTAMAAA